MNILNTYIFIPTLLLLTLLLSSCRNDQENNTPPAGLENIPPYSSYTFSTNSRVIDLGDQPYWIPAGIITEFMIRDQILHDELQKRGFTLRNHHFLKGSDMNYFMMRDDLEVGIGGDMPSLTIASHKDVSLLSIVKGSVSIVSNNIREISGLAGKKVAYAYGSNAHFFLLDTLHKSEISTSDLNLVQMDIVKMANALKQGKIDAYCTWEFTPSTTMKIVQDKMTTRKGLTYGFLYIRNDFFEDNQEVVNQLLASQVRAVDWLKADESNIKLMAYWLYSELNDWGQKENPLSLNRIMRHVNDALLYIQYGGYPRIPTNLLTTDGLLSRELEFLRDLGFIPYEVTFADIQSKFTTDYLEEVLAAPNRYRLHESARLVKER